MIPPEPEEKEIEQTDKETSCTEDSDHLTDEDYEFLHKVFKKMQEKTKTTKK